jgi:hypothetical protein
MALWGIDTLDDEIARLRALRFGGVGLAREGERMDTFGASLEQFEQLLRSAALSPPATSPLPLFYALSQAGRAIAAARHPDDEVWKIRGHGLRGPRGSYPAVIGNAVLRQDGAVRGAFTVVSQAVSSPVDEDQRLKLGELWASLPGVETGPGLGDESRRPILPQRGDSRGESWTFETEDLEASDVYHLEDKYPALAGDSGPVTITQDDPVRPGSTRGSISVPLGRGQLADFAETHLSDRKVVIRPAIGGRPGPSILMTWWAVLFGLSQLARYEPAAWTKAISPDHSPLTVPIESALRRCVQIQCRLVMHALTGEWTAGS